MINAIFLGLVQGLTEFLPVSSSGHLTLAQYFLGLADPEANLSQNLVLHFGSLLAVIWFFRADLTPYFTANGWRSKQRKRIFMLVFLGSIPTAAIALGGKKFFESLFGSPSLVCIALFATGLLLMLAEKLSKRESIYDLASFPVWGVLTIGVAQGLAVTPGISRSGSTIATAMLLGLSGADSAKLSFLLMIPAVGGATILEIRKLFVQGLPASLSATELVAGALTSFVTGILALGLLILLIKGQKLSLFSWYLFTVSIMSLILINFGGTLQ